jgi:hypothetical protein
MGFEPSGGFIVLNLDAFQADSVQTVKDLDGMFLSTEELRTYGIARSQDDDITRMSSYDSG